MIDRSLVWRLLGIAAALSLLGAGACLLHSLPLAAGVLLGFALGAFPFASWAWIVTRGLASTRARLFAVALLAVKLGLYGGTLYLFVTQPVVHPAGLFIGITLVAAVMTLGALAGGAPRPREAA